MAGRTNGGSSTDPSARRGRSRKASTCRAVGVVRNSIGRETDQLLVEPTVRPTSPAIVDRYYPYDGSLTFVRIRTASVRTSVSGAGQAGRIDQRPDRKTSTTSCNPTRELTVLDSPVERPIGAVDGNHLRRCRNSMQFLGHRRVGARLSSWMSTRERGGGPSQLPVGGTAAAIFDDFFAYEMENLVRQKRSSSSLNCAFGTSRKSTRIKLGHIGLHVPRAGSSNLRLEGLAASTPTPEFWGTQSRTTTGMGAW